MPIWTTTADFTTNNLPNVGPRGGQSYRPAPTAATYLPGMSLQAVALDGQLAPDHTTVQITPAGTTLTKIMGVVSSEWGGFINGNNTNTTYTTTTNNTGQVRGTQFIEGVVKGVAGVLIDQAGSGAVTVVDGLQIVSSRNTAGYGQGVAVSTAVGRACYAVASLPSTGIGSSFTAAALAQASTDFTVASPASGDIVNTTIQVPYTQAAPGVVQTKTWSLALNSVSAVSATTAALAILTYLNSQSDFATYFIATQTAGAVHIAVNGASAPWAVTFGSGSNFTGQVTIGLSGMQANLLTTVGSVTGAGGTTYSAAGTTFGGGTSAGTGYKGIIPAFIYGEF